jgi:hypothetical protein
VIVAALDGCSGRSLAGAQPQNAGQCESRETGHGTDLARGSHRVNVSEARDTRWGPGGRRFKSCLPDYTKGLQSRAFCLVRASSSVLAMEQSWNKFLFRRASRCPHPGFRTATGSFGHRGRRARQIASRRAGL